MVVVNGTSAAVQPASASAPSPMALSQETMEVSPSAPQASQMMHGDVASPCLADVVTPRLMTCNRVGSIGQGTSCQSLGTPTKLPAGTFPQAVSPSMMMTPYPYKTCMHGHWGFYKPDQERTREKMSMRCECKAFVKAKKNTKKGYWFFERIRLELSHPLHPSPRLTQFMNAHKNKDPVIMGIVDKMQHADASHNTTVNYLSDMYGGVQNFTFTEMDLKNSHASQRAEYKDFGDVVTFDTTYRTNMYSMPLAMFKPDTFEWLFKAFKNCMSGSEDPQCILTDQDSSMAAAISRVFPNTQHRLCQWHMIKKYRDELKKLYKEHEGLKIKLLTVINHPLTPIEFEAAWSELLTEYGIGENDAIKGIWESRHLWVSAYLKPLGFATRKTCMSKFARRMLEFIQHTNHVSAGETHCSQAENFRVTLQPFNKQLRRVYTRAMFKKYQETYIYSTAFRIDPEEGKANSYLVTHTNQSKAYSWFQHSFKVEADVNADRHDIVTMGPNYTNEQSRTTKLVELAMAIVRACCRSATGFDRECDDLAALATWAEAIPGDSGPSRVVEHENNQNVENDTREGSRATQIANDSQISDYAPKEVRTKGRKRGAQQIDNGDEGTTQGIRVCSYCGGKGHYITRCKLNPDNAEKQASKGMHGLMGRKRR
ncbi:hypothetical protein PVAP13_4KG238925 [Panicum virgatum]|uniref:Protein FAR1-RELATED SEQUENCE n=1 Tax=Panicum virgatum TaxID=38727 RepID=A0A8T0TP25_PANVG|nr:hypothetical protein PVAP13_4KG238925 [Panicum virgatum]